MRYNGALPDDSVNVHKENPLSTAFKLTASLTLLAIIGYLLVGMVINYAVAHITPAQEQRLTKALSLDMNASSASPYLDSVTQKLAQCALLPYTVRVAVMEDKEPNAFAVPGGMIYITRGMLKKIDSENELAFIIGHELGHFKHKDHLRALGYKVILGTISLVLGSDYGIAASTTLNIGSAKYSQSAELAADAFGLEVMNCAYGSVTEATKMFEKMDEGKEWRYFIATHPGFKQRIEKMQEKIESMGYDIRRKVVPLGKI